MTTAIAAKLTGTTTTSSTTEKKTEADPNQRPGFDCIFQTIADYVINYIPTSEEAYKTARYALMDALGCGILALQYSECTRLLGPLVPGTIVPHGSRVPGTPYIVDPVQGAFNIGTMIRWLDFNDTWLAAEWGHPSDNLGGILAVADYISRRGEAEKGDQSNNSNSSSHCSFPPNNTQLRMRDVLTALIKAYEIQGILALENSFNRVGLDHVILVKLATTAVAAHMIGCHRNEIVNAISQVFVDGQSLRTYRHAPNTGSRKSWAAGDATSRGVRLAMMSKLGEMGYPSACTANRWGFCDVSFHGKPLILSRDYDWGSYVMENILFKIAYPAEFHAQTAVECAVQLHPQVVKKNIHQINKIIIVTQEASIRIISKVGPLYNPADRDHCLQYMVAIALLFGELTAEHYKDEIAIQHAQKIDTIREKMHIQENKQYTLDYMDPEKRSIANSVQVFFKDGTSTENVTVEYPLGHRRRRKEGIPLLRKKLKQNLATHYPPDTVQKLSSLLDDDDNSYHELDEMPVTRFMELW